MKLGYRTLTAGIVTVAVALTGCGSSSTHSSATQTGSNAASPTSISPTAITVVPAPTAGGSVNLSRIIAATDRTLAAHSFGVKTAFEVDANGSTSKGSLAGVIDATGPGRARATTVAGTFE